MGQEITKEIKAPMTAGVIVHGIAVAADLLSVIFQNDVYKTMQGSFLNETVFPFTVVSHIIIMVMFIVFLMTMLLYKGTSRKLAGIVMVVIYCITGVVMPLVDIFATILTGRFAGAGQLAAYNTLKTFIGMVSSPFIVVSTVLVFIAIGRYGISKQDNNTFSDIKEGQHHDKDIH
ncbi:MAG: hypothetical protein IK093_16330 [Ruminiclostridium sp.]|nr:hypothetical protein [Ruminiclostridium sp.]